MRNDGSKAVLPFETQKACVIGRQKILDQLEDATLSWLDPDDFPFGCRDRQGCAKARLWLAVSVFKPFAAPNRSLQAFGELETEGLGLCKACYDHAYRKHEEGRSKMWDMMPENFGFPPWNELKKLDRWPES